MPVDRNVQMRQWLASHGGVVTIKLLVDMGFSQRSVYRMVERGELVILQPGVFQSTQWPTEEIQRLTAVCLRNPRVAIGNLTAARLWGFRKLPKDRLLHVLVPHGSSPILRDVVVHRCRRIDRIDIVTRRDGIRVTSPTRTLMDIAGSVGDIAATSILEQLIDEGRGTFATHTHTLGRLGHPQRPGTATLARVIAARPAWSSAMQSDLEAQVLAEIQRQGLPLPAVQYWFVLASGKRIRFDFAWPGLLVSLEVDHPFWHAGGEESHQDKRRDRLAAAEGWRTCRLTSFDVDHGLAVAVAEVGAVLDRVASANGGRSHG